MNILSIAQGFKIPFSQTPFQFGPPQLARVNQEEKLQINSEIKEMLRNGAIQQVKSGPEELLSNLFLVNKKDRGQRPVINLKFLNSFIPYQHFKMEGMHLIKDLLQEHDFLIKIDLKDAYFGIPLNKSPRKYIRFHWEGNLYEFFCLCFGLGPVLLIFTKLLKIRIALLRRIDVRINIFGRHVSNGPNVGRNLASKEDIDFSVTKFRFYHKSKKVATNTSEGNRVFGVSDKFSKHDVSLASGKSFGYPKQVRATSSVTKDHNYGINQTPRETLVH